MLPSGSEEADPSKVQLSDAVPQLCVKLAVGGRLPPPPPVFTNSSWLGEPVPGLVTLFGVESATSRSRTCCAVKPGFALRISAAPPATCGDAIEVPLMVLVAVSELNHAEVMLVP